MSKMKKISLIMLMFIGMMNVNAQIEINSEIDSIKIAQKQIEFYIKKHENELFRLKTDLSNTNIIFDNRINQFSKTKKQAQNLRIFGFALNVLGTGLMTYMISNGESEIGVPLIFNGVGCILMVGSLGIDRTAYNDFIYETKVKVTSNEHRTVDLNQKKEKFISNW